MAVGMRKWCGPNHLDKVLEFYIPVNVIIYYVVISLFFLHTEKCYVYVSGSVSSSVYCLIFVSTPLFRNGAGHPLVPNHSSPSKPLYLEG